MILALFTGFLLCLWLVVLFTSFREAEFTFYYIIGTSLAIIIVFNLFFIFGGIK